MISIKGVSLKSLTEGIGDNKDGFQADVYFRNQKIGYILKSSRTDSLEVSIDKRVNRTTVGQFYQSIAEVLRILNVGALNLTIENFFHFLYTQTSKRR